MVSFAKSTLDKIAVMQAYTEGAVIQQQPAGILTNAGWETLNEQPVWDWFTTVYRVKPIAPDWVDWDGIADRFQYMARDQSGTIFLYEDEPRIEQGSPVWTGFGACRIDLFYKGYKDNGGPWRNSLVVRPEATE